jgi:hypothetical protein
MKEDGMGGHVARMGKLRSGYKILVGNPEGKRPLEEPFVWWKYNIKMGLREIMLEGVDWFHLAQDRDR